MGLTSHTAHLKILANHWPSGQRWGLAGRPGMAAD